MERELRAAVAHACAQQAALAVQLLVAHTTIKQQALALDQQAAVTVTTFGEIQSAGQHVSGVRAPAWHGIPSSAGVHENCALDSLNPDAPAWLQSRIQWHGKQVFQNFASVLQRIFGWFPGQHQCSHGSGGSVMSVLGILASHPIDNHGSFTVRAFLTGVCQQMAVRDGIDRALRGAPSLWRTLRSVIGPYICPQAPDIVIAAWSVGVSVDQSYRIANSASYMAPDTGKTR